MKSKVEFNHKLLPDGESTVIKVEFLELSYEIRGDADFVIDAFRELCDSETFVSCMAAAFTEVAPAEVVNAMRLGGFPDEYVVDFEKTLESSRRAA